MKRFIGCLAVMAGLLAGGIGLAGADQAAASAPSSQAAATQSSTHSSTRQASLVTNGDFSLATKDASWPDDWGHPKGASWETEAGTHFMRLQSSQPGETVLLYRAIRLPDPAPAALEIRLKVRYSDVKVGKQKWFDARVMGHFKDKAGAVLKPDPSPPAFHGTSKGWVEKSYYVKVPAGSRELELMPSVFQAESGTLDLADVEVYPASAEKLPKPPPIIPSALMPLPGGAGGAAGKLPPELHVSGNQLLTPEGKSVWLQGLCLDSLEWADGGEHLDKSVPEAIDVWHANVIRLPVNGEFWFGRPAHNQKPRDGGLKYRAIVDSVVAATETRGAYLVFDLHSFGHPTELDVAFWKDAATRYKDNPGVLFELFNEPHDLSWKAWRYGGSLKDGEGANKGGDKVVKENNQVQTGDTTVGMQALVDAVRSTGAKNLVIAGGLAWGFDLSGVLQGYALKDDGGDGIMYSSHLYPWKIGYQKSTLDAAAKYPIFVGEVGCPEKWSDFKFIPKAEQYEDLSKNEWQPDILGMFQKYHLNWTGFSFHPKCGPPLIKDWDYTPTAYWGVWVKEALAGKQFTMKRLR